VLQVPHVQHTRLRFIAQTISPSNQSNQENNPFVRTTPLWIGHFTLQSRHAPNTKKQSQNIEYINLLIAQNKNTIKNQPNIPPKNIF
jgi:hypothetical protein